MPSARVTILLAGLAVLVVATVVRWEPFLSRPRDYPASIPQPSPLFSVALVDLRGGQEACFPDAVMDPRSEQARFRIGTLGRPGVPLRLSITAPGYRVARAIPGTYADNELLRVAVRPPARATAVEVCLANAGRRRVSVYASNDRTEAPYETLVDGRPAPADPQWAFFERRPVSIADRLPVVADRLGAFRPWWVAPWLLWPLGVLVVVGVPLAALVAVARGERDDEPAD